MFKWLKNILGDEDDLVQEKMQEPSSLPKLKSELKSDSKLSLVPLLESKQVLIRTLERENDKLNRKIQVLELEKKQLKAEVRDWKKQFKAKEKVLKIYPRYIEMKRALREIELEQENLKKQESDFKKREKILDLEQLIQREFDYEQRKSRLLENEIKLKREEKWMKEELRYLEREKTRLIDENIRSQRLIYLETEKNEHLLFVLRSFNMMNPLYESIVYEMTSSIKNIRIRNIISDYLMGKSFYEIAHAEGKSMVSIKRTFLLSTYALRKRCKKKDL